MSVFPKLIFLKGDITNSKELTEIFQRDGGTPVNFTELAVFLTKQGLDINKGQIFTLGESEGDKFTVIVTQGIDSYSTINVEGKSEEISNFLIKK